MFRERSVSLARVVVDQPATLASARWRWIFAILILVGLILIVTAAFLLRRESRGSVVSAACFWRLRL